MYSYIKSSLLNSLLANGLCIIATAKILSNTFLNPAQVSGKKVIQMISKARCIYHAKIQPINARGGNSGKSIFDGQ